MRQGEEHFQKAKAVIVSGYSIETPRLLLNSACDGYENGLANSSGTVGRYLMAQAGNVVLGRFEEPVRMYKAPPAHALTEEFYETDPKRDFARGFAIQTVGPLPIAFAKQMMAARGSWGWGMRRIMMDYNHWSAFGLLGEILPWADNRVTLAEEKDQFGLRVAHVNFDLHDNDKKLIEFGKAKVEEVMRAAGAQEIVQEARYAHLVGAARMGKDPATSVVDGYRPHARHRQPLRLRRQHPADAGLGQSGPDHPGAGRAHGRLPHLAGHERLHFRSARHDAAAGPPRAFAARHARRRRAARRLKFMATPTHPHHRSQDLGHRRGLHSQLEQRPRPRTHQPRGVLHPERLAGRGAHQAHRLLRGPRSGGIPSSQVAARRTKHFRFNNLTEPEKIPHGTSYASVFESNVPIVIQHTRLDSRQAENALMTTMAFPGEE